MKNHFWLYRLTKKPQGYNRCMKCGLNKVYIDYLNGYIYFYDEGERMTELPSCK